jgi:hypothetical protein
MARLEIAFGEEVNTARLLVYWDRVRSHSDETFTGAADRIIDTERRFPNVATIHGHCDRVREEAAARQQSAVDETPRLRRGERLPDCATCLDSGWTRTENPLPNQPSTLTKCPDCDTARKGRDLMFNSRQRDAVAYMIDREHAQYPAFQAVTGEADPAMTAADVADRLRMDRRR